MEFKWSRNKELELFKPNWKDRTLSQWGKTVLEANRPFWPKETTTEGVPWAPLGPRYAKIKARRYKGNPILRASGKMLDSAYLRGSGGKLIVVSTKYGKYHQFGTSKMKARPWMGIPVSSMDDLANIALKNILRNRK
jgi:phage gpG-like protein